MMTPNERTLAICLGIAVAILFVCVASAVFLGSNGPPSCPDGQHPIVAGGGKQGGTASWRCI